MARFHNQAMTIMPEQQLNVNPLDRPVFADEMGVSIRIKAVKDDKSGKVEKEGVVGIMFIDSIKKQLIGEFIVNKSTAKNFAKVLEDSVAKMEKELASKEMPKQPEVKTTGDFSNIR